MNQIRHNWIDTFDWKGERIYVKEHHSYGQSRIFYTKNLEMFFKVTLSQFEEGSIQYLIRTTYQNLFKKKEADAVTQKELSPVVVFKEMQTIEGEDLCELIELTKTEDEYSEIDYKTPALSLDESIKHVYILEGNLANVKGRKHSYQSDMTNSHANRKRDLHCKSSHKPI